MNKKETADKSKYKPQFTPDLGNFRTSLAYEGMQLKQGEVPKSISELKRKYAR